LDDCRVKVTYAHFLRRQKVRLKDPTGGFRTGWSGPVIGRISGILKRAN